MSMRLFSVRLVKHGRCFLRSFCNRDIHTNILEQTNLKTVNRRNPTSAASNVVRLRQPELVRNAAKTTTPLPINSGIYRVGQHARKLFIDNILNRVTTNYSNELRQQATKKLFYGDSAPFFALIGVSLASGSGVLSKEDELEGVCWEIRQAAERLQTLWNKDDLSNNIGDNLSVDNLDVGPPIAKGCAAVVYAASLKDDNAKQNEETQPGYAFEQATHPSSSTVQQLSADRLRYMSPISNMSHFVHNNFGASAKSSTTAFLTDEFPNLQQRPDTSMKSSEQESEAVETAAPTTSHTRSGVQNKLSLDTISSASLARYPLALKMMFNYDIQSNALSILRAMYKETVPARHRQLDAASDEFQRLVQHQTPSLPPHPNIVCMFGFFCDEVRNFPDGNLLYPIAQPQRINPMGYGRNMSLYLLMKRYDLNLRDLLDMHNLMARTRLLLFAQLLEAVTHINRHGIAHRDLKSDNILIELNGENGASETSPILVLSDFGCCLADKLHGLQVPYNSYDVDKGGNSALMAPEIINKQPGAFTVLNYEKSDLWACGAIAYEIFGLLNPFYSTSNGLAHAKGELTYSLKNNDYKEEDLQPLNDACPPLVQQLIYNILNPNPSKRLSPDVAANVMQLFLWAPSNWLKAGCSPNSSEIMQWLLTLTTKVMCEGRPRIVVDNDERRSAQYGRHAYVEYLLVCSFLARARLRRIRHAMNWIQSVVA